ncbi:hypothetical protein CN907_23635, partial [Bacillus anthracis]
PIQGDNSIRTLNDYCYLTSLIYQPLPFIRLFISEVKIKGKAFWLRKTEIHLPPIVGVCPSHA